MDQRIIVTLQLSSNSTIRMLSEALRGFKSAGNFAKYYRRNNGKMGVNRNYIYQLRDKEKAEPGSTGLEFLEIDGALFVRYV